MSTFGDAKFDPPADSPATGEPPGHWSDALLPPDFYPERQVDAGTWAEALFEPIALVGATVCFVLGIVAFGLAIVPEWPTRFLVVLSAIIGVEAFLYSRRLTRSAFLFKEWLVLLVPPIVLVKFLPYLDDPTASLARDVANWWHDPGTFFTVGFIADTIVLLFVWAIVFVCTQSLNQLRVQEGEIFDQTDPRFKELYEDNWRSYDHSEPLRRIGQFYLWGGVILVILAAMASIGTTQLFNAAALGQLVGFQRPSLHLALANVFVYFVLGLLLLGEAHYVRQRTIWRLDHLSVPSEVATRWVGAVIGLVVAAAVIAVILPTSYAVTLGELVGYVVYVFAEAFAYLVAAIFYVIYIIARLFGGKSGGSAEAPHPAAPPHLPPAAAAPPGASPLDAVRSLIFWAIALGILLYSLGVLWRKRGPSLANLPLARILLTPVRLILWLVGLVGRIGREVGQAVASAVPTLFRKVPAAAPRVPRFMSLSRLGPRELVEYFYLSVCERAGQLGHPRPPGVTPLEYREILRETLPLVDPELDALTDAFVEARYGPHPTTRSRAQVVREQWQNLKVKLRRARVLRARPPTR
ncbi:MAG: DUF4129 domain-containing protein [Chloroflexota bacterium]